MSTNPNPPAYPEPTEAEWEAMFQSVVWFREHECPRAYEKYAGKHVAILGEQIIDLDADKDALAGRVEAAHGGRACWARVVLQYVPPPEESIQY